MSATVADPATKLRVEIDDELRRDPTLLRDVELATADFREVFQGLPEDPRWSKPFLRWRRSKSHPDFALVEFTEEHSEEGRYARSYEFPMRRLHDPVMRGSCMTPLYFKVSKQRSDILHKEMRRLIDEIESEEAGG